MTWAIFKEDWLQHIDLETTAPVSTFLPGSWSKCLHKQDFKGYLLLVILLKFSFISTLQTFISLVLHQTPINTGSFFLFLFFLSLVTRKHLPCQFFSNLCIGNNEAVWSIHFFFELEDYILLIKLLLFVEKVFLTKVSCNTLWGSNDSKSPQYIINFINAVVWIS